MNIWYKCFLKPLIYDAVKSPQMILEFYIFSSLFTSWEIWDVALAWNQDVMVHNLCCYWDLTALNIHIAHFPALLHSVLLYCCPWLLSYHCFGNWLHLDLVHHSFMGLSNERICEWYKAHQMAMNSQSSDSKSVLTIWKSENKILCILMDKLCFI